MVISCRWQIREEVCCACRGQQLACARGEVGLKRRYLPGVSNPTTRTEEAGISGGEGSNPEKPDSPCNQLPRRCGWQSYRLQPLMKRAPLSLWNWLGWVRG